MAWLHQFHFLRPLWLLALPFWGAFVFYFWRQRGQASGWQQIADPALFRYLTGAAGEMGAPRSWPRWALLVGGALLWLALAGPVFQQLPQPLFRAQSGAVIVLDLSQSMRAADLKPSRLVRAKQKLQDILQLRREGQTGLIVFAGSAFDVVPMTSDYRAIVAMLDALTPSIMPAQGSMASLALQRAGAMLQRNRVRHGTVLLLTDGVDAAAVSAAERLRAAGQRVHVIGIGTAAGAPIPLDSDRGSGFVQDDAGNIVIAKLQADRLRAVAEAGGGVYRPISFDDRDIQALPGLKPDRLATQLQKEKMEKMHTDLWREEGPWLVLLVLPLLSLIFRRGVLLLLIVPWLCPDPSYAMQWQDLWQRPDQQAAALMAHDPAKAAARFSDRQWQGAAYYRAGKYAQAAKAFGTPHSADGWYNKGNALAKAGKLKAALDAYNHALKIDPQHADAAFNRDLVNKALQQQQQRKQQPSSGKQAQQQSDQHKPAQEKKPSQGGKPSASPDRKPGKQGKQQNDRRSSAKQQRQGGQQKQQSKQSAQQSQAEQSKAQPKSQRLDQRQQIASGKQSEGQRGGKQGEKRAAMPKDGKQREQPEAMQQWLRRIPDDPGGLLRRKFQYQYQQQTPSSSGQAW